MNGFDCFTEGFALIRAPGLRRYVIIPTVINVLVLVLLVSLSVSHFGGWVDQAVAMLPDWLSFLSWLIWLLALIAVVFVLFYLFTILANIIASPFNAVLSVKVEARLTGKEPESELSPWLLLPRALWREISKLLYLLPRLLGLLIISFIPLVNAVAPFLWILFGAWMMAVQYTDYAADNNDISFNELRRRLGRQRIQSVMFGLPAYLLLAIPLVNLVLMPVGVAGGTVYFVRNLKT